MHTCFHLVSKTFMKPFCVCSNEFSNELISVLINEEAITNNILCFHRELQEEVDGESTFDAETMICAGRLNGHGNACYVRFVILDISLQHLNINK